MDIFGRDAWRAKMEIIAHSGEVLGTHDVFFDAKEWSEHSYATHVCGDVRVCADIRGIAKHELRALFAEAESLWFSNWSGVMRMSLKSSEVYSGHGMCFFAKGALIKYEHLWDDMQWCSTFDPAVVALLESRPRTRAVLIESYPHLTSAFGMDMQCDLLISGSGDDAHIVAHINSPSGAKSDCASLDTFEKSWWFERVQDADYLLMFMVNPNVYVRDRRAMFGAQTVKRDAEGRILSVTGRSRVLMRGSDLEDDDDELS